jgi:HTH-type transcriptional regulator / antitoxin HigA
MGGKMTATAIKKDILNVGAPRVITSDAQNERYIAALLEMDRRGNLTSDEKSLKELLALLIGTYEARRYEMQPVSPVKVLRELMAANGLKQKDLANLLGSESVVSEILSGSRELNKHHIIRLSHRFRVSPALFF